MRMPIFLSALILHLALSGSATAVPPGKKVTWKTAMGAVVFSGSVHADHGVSCVDCHPQVFDQKKGAARFKMSDIKAGKFCGACHNGERAFKASDGLNCLRCHNR
ncbi:MAG: c(7)-type cytochrome triheme domain-containing protein [Nitrospirota bacterium]